MLSETNARTRRKLVAWNRASPIPGWDARTWRKDDYGRFIHFEHYGNRYSAFGWEVDHIIPLANGGMDIDTNLRALNWFDNASRGS